MLAKILEIHFLLERIFRFMFPVGDEMVVEGFLFADESWIYFCCGRRLGKVFCSVISRNKTMVFSSPFHRRIYRFPRIFVNFSKII